MGKTKTFRQIIDGGYQYPSSVDAATQATILDWYQFRHVTDDEKFGTYFSRVLNRDYHRYRQMLRIEPGIKGDTGFVTNFDWMVSEYLEKMDEIEYNEGVSGTSTNTESGTKTSTGGTTDGGKDTTTTTGTDVTNYGKISDNKNKTTETITSDKSSDSGNTTENRAQAMARNNPMSQSYTDSPDGGQMGENDHRRGYITDTTNGYNVGKKKYNEGVDTDSSYIVGLNEDFPKMHITNPSSTSDAHSTTGNISSNKAHTEGETHTETQNNETESGSDEFVKDDTKETTYGKTTTNSNSETVSNTKSGSTETTNEGSSTHKTRHSGRSNSPQELLEKAKVYIETTSAWEWFREQLDVCFMSNLDY